VHNCTHIFLAFAVMMERLDSRCMMFHLVTTVTCMMDQQCMCGESHRMSRTEWLAHSQAFVLKAFHGNARSQATFNFPFSIEFTFIALKAHVKHHHDCKPFCMQNWRVPMFPTLMKDPSILNQMINAVNPATGPKVEAACMIHFNTPASFVLSLTTCALLD
jgi:hypothetical protein